MILINAMQKYNMIRVFHTDKDKFVQITPLNPEEIRQGLFGDKASDLFDKVSEIFPDVQKAFANKMHGHTILNAPMLGPQTSPDLCSGTPS